MLNNIKHIINTHFNNFRGWSTNRKLVVIESDDWGSIRMPSKEVFEEYSGLGYNIKSDPYNRFDTLANSTDLNALFEVLNKYKDRSGNHPVITFNTVVANPDFNRIKATNYTEYYYEPFTETLKRYYPDENVFAIWQQGINQRLIYPQFHGREHVNVPLWLELLRNGNKPLLDAFELGFWGIPQKLYSPARSIQASFYSAKPEHLAEYKTTIKEGLKLFEQLFGYKSQTFIANNFIWAIELNETLAEMEIKGLQGMHYHIFPKNNSKIGLNRVFTGKRNVYKQIYTIRNCQYEPSQTNSRFDNINNCLRDIQRAFFWKKPAIISSHRINFTGSINEDNRKHNLLGLNILLKEILIKWPDAEFVTSADLLSIIDRDDC
ncbi:MAG: hypothetical protein WBJ84_08500 [Bacteroidales bacterium]